MITVNVGTALAYDEANNKFVEVGGRPVRFEHSLLSLSKWEAKYCKPFLGQDKKTGKESMDYLLFMALDPVTENEFTEESVEKLSAYIRTNQSATTIKPNHEPGSKSIIMTSEVIYAYMALGGIDFKAEEWFLPRLIKTIEVISELNKPDKKMSKRETMLSNAQLNRERKRKYNTKG